MSFKNFCFYMAIVPFSMVVGYFVGLIFDGILGTSATPLLTVGVAVLGFSQRRINAESSVVSLIVSFCAVVLAGLTATLVFPALSNEFLAMVQYDGSILSFTIWAAVASTIAYAIIGAVIGLGAAIVEKVATS